MIYECSMAFPACIFGFQVGWGKDGEKKKKHLDWEYDFKDVRKKSVWKLVYISAYSKTDWL